MLFRSDYITIPAAGTFIEDGDYTSCVAEGDFITQSGSDACSFHIAIEIPAGKTLSSVTMYYYDNSGSQQIYASLYKMSLTSTSTSATEIDTIYDTSTSSSVQYSSFTVGATTSSSYTYFILAMLTKGTRFQGAKVYYY